MLKIRQKQTFFDIYIKSKDKIHQNLIFMWRIHLVLCLKDSCRLTSSARLKLATFALGFRSGNKKSPEGLSDVTTNINLYFFFNSSCLIVSTHSRYLRSLTSRDDPDCGQPHVSGDTDFSPPTAAVKFLLQFIPLPTLRLEAGDFLLFYKSSVFLKRLHY